MKTNTKRKAIEEKLNLEKSDVIYCVECGEVLDDFSFDEVSKNVDAVKKNFHNCKETGKFKGDICSKLYIIDESEPDEDE
jgi:uncharacterized protein with PIN domain